MSKGTPHRPIRISDESWAKAQEKAKRLGTTASAKARELLEAWADEPDAGKPDCGIHSEGEWPIIQQLRDLST